MFEAQGVENDKEFIRDIVEERCGQCIQLYLRRNLEHI
jgi:hypothetical protein